MAGLAFDIMISTMLSSIGGRYSRGRGWGMWRGWGDVAELCWMMVVGGKKCGNLSCIIPIYSYNPRVFIWIRHINSYNHHTSDTKIARFS